MNDTAAGADMARVHEPTSLDVLRLQAAGAPVARVLGGQVLHFENLSGLVHTDPRCPAAEQTTVYDPLDPQHNVRLAFCPDCCQRLALRQALNVAWNDLMWIAETISEAQRALDRGCRLNEAAERTLRAELDLAGAAGSKAPARTDADLLDDDAFWWRTTALEQMTTTLAGIRTELIRRRRRPAGSQRLVLFPDIAQVMRTYRGPAALVRASAATWSTVATGSAQQWLAVHAPAPAYWENDVLQDTLVDLGPVVDVDPRVWELLDDVIGPGGSRAPVRKYPQVFALVRDIVAREPGQVTLTVLGQVLRAAPSIELVDAVHCAGVLAQSLDPQRAADLFVRLTAARPHVPARDTLTATLGILAPV